MKLKLEYNNLLDVINLNFKVYNPLKEFVSKKDFISIVKKKDYQITNFFQYQYLSIFHKIYTIS